MTNHVGENAAKSFPTDYLDIKFGQCAVIYGETNNLVNSCSMRPYEFKFVRGIKKIKFNYIPCVSNCPEFQSGSFSFFAAGVQLKTVSNNFQNNDSGSTAVEIDFPEATNLFEIRGYENKVLRIDDLEITDTNDVTTRFDFEDQFGKISESGQFLERTHHPLTDLEGESLNLPGVTIGTLDIPFWIWRGSRVVEDFNSTSSRYPNDAISVWVPYAKDAKVGWIMQNPDYQVPAHEPTFTFSQPVVRFSFDWLQTPAWGLPPDAEYAVFADQIEVERIKFGPSTNGRYKKVILEFPNGIKSLDIQNINVGASIFSIGNLEMTAMDPWP